MTHRPIVTLAAEHGAAGDLVAPRVADALGVPYLDRALPASLATASMESDRPSGLVGALARASTMLAGEAVERMDLNEGHIRAELAAFLAKSSTEGGVVLGRGGVLVLADAPAVLHVLLTGDRERRVERVAEREGIDPEVAARRVREHDRTRKAYVRRAFGVEPDDRALYHLIVDTVALGLDASVDLVIAAARSRIEDEMLSPRQSATGTGSLDGLWRFALDAAASAATSAGGTARCRATREMPVPASYNDIFPDARGRDHVGDVWYQRTSGYRAAGTAQRIVLRFDAATHRADGLGRRHAGRRARGRLHAVRGGRHRARASRRGSARDRRGQQRADVDVDPAGLRRGARRTAAGCSGTSTTSSTTPACTARCGCTRTPRAHVEDITVTTGARRLDGASSPTAQSSRATAARGARRACATPTARGRAAPRAPRATLGSRTCTPVAARRAATSTPRRRAAGADGEVVDTTRSRSASARSRCDGQQFLINGEPFYFKGFGKHEDSRSAARGTTTRSWSTTSSCCEWIGANSFRTSHYPYAEDVLDYADRHGIVVIDETAAVGLNLDTGTADPRPDRGASDFYSEDTISDAHAGGPPASDPRARRARQEPPERGHVEHRQRAGHRRARGARATSSRSSAETRRLDPTRPVAFANFMLATPERDVVSDLFDVLLLNRYYGWYIEHGRPGGGRARLEAELRAVGQKHGKPIIMTEYGADTLAGLHSRDRRALDRGVPDRPASTCTTGSSTGSTRWSASTSGTSPTSPPRSGIIRVDGNKKGVFTRDRRPKAAAHALRQRWRAGA